MIKTRKIFLYIVLDNSKNYYKYEYKKRILYTLFFLLLVVDRDFIIYT